MTSPVPGRSIFRTSAPMSASRWLANGPAAASSKARTRTPLRADSAIDGPAAERLRRGRATQSNNHATALGKPLFEADVGEPHQAVLAVDEILDAGTETLDV